jgi:hypothetical protein
MKEYTSYGDVANLKLNCSLTHCRTLLGSGVIGMRYYLTLGPDFDLLLFWVEACLRGDLAHSLEFWKIPFRSSTKSFLPR